MSDGVKGVQRPTMIHGTQYNKTQPFKGEQERKGKGRKDESKMEKKKRAVSNGSLF